MTNKSITRTEYDGYVFSNGWTMKRERGETPNGNQINDRWVLRNQEGGWVDYDQYRHDLAGRHGLDLYAENTIQVS